MSNLLEDLNAAAARDDAKPIVARLPAEPGWRVVLMVPQGEPRPDGRQTSRMEVHAVGFWGFGPDFLPSRRTTIFSGSGPSPSLIPIDTDGRRFPVAQVQAIEPPGREDEAVLAEANARYQRVSAAYDKGGTLAALVESMKERWTP